MQNFDTFPGLRTVAQRDMLAYATDAAHAQLQQSEALGAMLTDYALAGTRASGGNITETFGRVVGGKHFVLRQSAARFRNHYTDHGESTGGPTKSGLRRSLEQQGKRKVQ